MYERIQQLPLIVDAIATHTVNEREFVLARGRVGSGRYVGDPFVNVAWGVYHNGKLMGRIYDGYAYGWGQYHASLSGVRGCGFGLGDDHHDHNQHDLPPLPGNDFMRMFHLVAFRADYIMTKRAKIQAQRKVA